MKVLLFNGSPHVHGTTAACLDLVREELEAAGIETVTLQVGTKPVRGCIGCGRCKETRLCVFDDDPANEFIHLFRECDGVVLGAPTYYFSAAGQARAVLDRAFFAMSSQDVAFKPCGVLSVARRAGTVTALQELLHYPLISQMPVVSTCYMPVAFGNNAEQLAKDEEGVRIMRTLGRNMAWMMRSLEAAKAAGVETPEPLPRAVTNFIR